MHIAILGNGISGTTAARFIRKLSDHKITLISAESELPYSRTALMYIFMGHVPFEQTCLYTHRFFESNRINRVMGRVKNIDFQQKRLHFEPNQDPTAYPPPADGLAYDVLILATGSQPNKFGWPGQELGNVHGLYDLQDLQSIDRLSSATQTAVIVGGGLIGVELAEMMHSRGKKVSMLVRESSYWNNVLPPEESAMVNDEIKAHHIDLRLHTELKEIRGDSHGNCSAVLTDKGDVIECEFTGLTAGVHPNIGFLRSSELETDRGILVDTTLRTNLPDVYAIGDCAQLKSPNPGRKAIEAVWYTGKMMGEIAAYNICGSEKNYHPGIWFNSAKFFDLEYQVYGQVPPQIEPPLRSFLWCDPHQRRSIRIVYQEDGEVVVGFNLMGIRFRQELCHHWIQEQKSLTFVMEHLPAAFFDPELYRPFESALLEAFQKETRTSIQWKSRRGLRAFYQQMQTLLKRK
jgi:NADPH-dependent 2,4-dienoyl-CoA reductase/sulfur reductase-like enzyme